MARNTLARSAHDLGLAAWFGGALMGAVGVNGAAASLRDPAERSAAATVGWTRWAPLSAVAIGAHLVGAVQLLRTERYRVRHQDGVARSSAIKTGLTVAAHTVRKTLKAIKLGVLDSLAGAFLGLVRAAFGLSIFLRVTGVSIVPGGEPLLISSETREASVLYPPVEAAAPAVWNAARTVFPGAQERLGSLFNSFDEGG